MAPVIITGTWVGVETLLMASVGTTPGKWLFGCYVQYSISDAYARREMKSQIWRSFKRAFRVWWEGMGCGFPLIAPILIAIAYERLAQNHESDWDFAQDCLATHAPPGALNMATGVCGLAAMLWLYGVAWHRPLADTIGKVGTTIVAAMPSVQSIIPTGLTDGSVITGVTGGIRGPDGGSGRPVAGASGRRSMPTSRRCSPTAAPGRRIEGRRAARACGPGTIAGPPSNAARGRTSSSPTPRRGAAWAMRCRGSGVIRKRSTRSARRSSSILPTAHRCGDRAQPEGHRRRFPEPLQK